MFLPRASQLASSCTLTHRFVTHEQYLGLEDSLKLLVNCLENMV